MTKKIIHDNIYLFAVLKETIINKSDIFPDERDLKGAGSALLRLQDVYSLETEQIVKGDIKGVTGSPTLTGTGIII